MLTTIIVLSIVAMLVSQIAVAVYAMVQSKGQARNDTPEGTLNF